MVDDVSQKRFIAGAVCPRCRAVDKIRIFKKDHKQYRDCVSCGFEEIMDPSEVKPSSPGDSIVTDRQ